MNAQTIIQFVVLLDAILTKGPALLAAAKAALSQTNEADLQVELKRLQDQNDVDYTTALAALDRVAGAPPPADPPA